jgi:copper(I)-binding protein
MFAKTLLTLSLLVASTLLGSTLMASAHEFKLGDLVIGHPWSRATPGGAKIGGGYLTITNNGGAPDRLVSATVPAVSDHVEIHQMAMNNGVMTMRQVPDGVTVAPGKTVAFAPGGYHLMLTGLKTPLKEGDRLKATLTIEKAGAIDVTFNVEGIGAQHPAPGEDHSQHKM